MVADWNKYSSIGAICHMFFQEASAGEDFGIPSCVFELTPDPLAVLR